MASAKPPMLPRMRPGGRANTAGCARRAIGERPRPRRLVVGNGARLLPICGKGEPIDGGAMDAGFDPEDWLGRVAGNLASRGGASDACEREEQSQGGREAGHAG